MGNSLQDNVLTYFENPEPFDWAWVHSATAGILKHGILSASERGLPWTDVYESINDMLGQVVQTIDECAQREITLPDDPRSSLATRLIDEVQGARTLVTDLAEREQRLRAADRLQAEKTIGTWEGVEAAVNSPAKLEERRRSTFGQLNAEVGRLESMAVAGKVYGWLEARFDPSVAQSIAPNAPAATQPPEIPGR